MGGENPTHRINVNIQKGQKMARTKKEIKEFVEQEQDQSLYEIARDEAEVLDPNTKDDFVSARVKGSWVMFWSHTSYSFNDGQRYKLPRELFNYLKRSGNIYDTL